MASIYAHIHNLYMPKQVWHHILYVYGFETLFYTLSYVKKENGDYTILDINDQNTTCVFEHKGIWTQILTNIKGHSLAYLTKPAWM